MCLFRIERKPLDTGNITRIVRRSQLRDGLVIAAEQTVDDRLLVDGVSDSTPQIDIVERRNGRIELQIGDAFRYRRQHLDAARPLKLGAKIRIERHGKIRASGLQIGDASGSVRHSAEFGTLKIALAAPIAIVAHQGNGNTALPLFEFVRP